LISAFGVTADMAGLAAGSPRQRAQVRIVRLGSIAIPKQGFAAQNQLYDCEHMVFNPWNSLPEHRPLGSVNRMRFAVYLASRQVRRKTEHGGS
jgi:hypothetical protein